MNRRGRSFGNRILIPVCIVLIAILGVFLIWSHREEQKTIQQLQQESEKAEETEQIKKTEESNDAAEGSADSAETSGEGEAAGTTPAPTATPEQSRQDAQIQGISFRGDCFISDEEKENSGYVTRFEEILAEHNVKKEVADYTMDEAGSLSQMKLAGVPQAELDAYVTKHRDNAQGAALRITETKIRELTEEELVRDDQAYLPVICMGYYGGWGNDPKELIEQQEKLLATYDQQEKYLILGVSPAGYNDSEGYHQAMTQQWGEHYLRLDGSALTDEGKQQIAEAVYEKLNSMGYLV
ncbi:MAG: hypothetical protein KH921_09245 [Erysipelotrichaceae bacterium]|nr:hypothetical protein [Erysipelotrichaceae bacterium]